MTRYQAEPDPFPPPTTEPEGRPPARRMNVDAAARTDRGQERAENQDRAVIADCGADQAWEPPAVLGARVAPSGAFYALVCDGMGGEAGGAVASGLAVETVVGAMRARWLDRAAAPTSGVERDEIRIANALIASLESASARIQQAARDEPLHARMGTTATLATIAHGSLLCAQVGDSRAYILRGDRIVQVTEDQTMVELLRKSGNLTEEQIASIVGPNVILQALGSSTRLEVALTRTPLAQHDVLLLCSDGLHGVVDDPTIAEVIRDCADLATACDRLVDRANAAGGPDNISCVLFRVAGDALPAPELATSPRRAT